MELFLKRHFWVVTAIVIVICAAFGAMATVNFIEAGYLLDQNDDSGDRPPVKRPVTPRPATPADKDADVLVARNMFCATCEPPAPVPPQPGDNAPPSDGSVPLTSLPLALLATNVASDPALSSATVMNTSNNHAGAYWTEEIIPGAGTIVRVTPAFVEFENQTAGNRRERIDLRGATAPRPTATAARPATPATGDAGDLTAEIDKGVKKIDDTTFEIDRDLVDKLLNDPALIAKSARIVPSIKDGKANGFKVYAIRPNSVYAKIGLQNGDTLHAVNGFEISSPDKAFEVYGKVKSANSLSVSVTRRGQPATLNYTIK
jgi:general secretion pathway protein C